MLPSGPCPARIMIVGEAPGEREIASGQPFMGAAGQELNTMLHEAGIMRSECFVTNVCRERPLGNDIGQFVAFKKKDITMKHQRVRDKWVTFEVVHGLELLQREVALCKPTVIIALGNLALWALTGEWGITKWRGSILPALPEFGSTKVIPTIHPASVLRVWPQRALVVCDLKRVKRELAWPEIRKPSYNFIVRPTYNQVISTLDWLLERVRQAPTKLSVDLETRAGHTACCGIAWTTTDAICIPLMCTERWDGYWMLDEEVVIMWKLYHLLTHPNTQVIGQNFTYDMQYFFRWHFFMPRLTHDTLIAQHTMFPDQEKALDVLSSLYCEYHRYWKDDGKLWDASMPEDQLWVYNCEDCVRTLEIANGQELAIAQMGLEEVHRFQQRLAWPVIKSMNRGLRVDRARKEAIVRELHGHIAERKNDVNFILGYDINLSSPIQLQDLFYRQLQQRVVLERKKKTPTTNDEALNTIATREPLLKPLCTLIAQYRSLSVFSSTFAEAELDYDGRMRCSYNIGGTVTFRFSSSKNAFGSGLNLQNIPKGDEENEGLPLPNIRSLFIPDPGMEFFDIDLSSADLRIVVWESGEEELKQMLAAGLDPYTEVAKEFYNDPTISKKDSRRQLFKSFCHGTNYLGSARGLAQRLNLSVAVAERTQAWYFKRFPRIKEWQENLKHQIAHKRYVSNIFGYRLNILDRVDDNTYRECAAWIPQSTVACLINRAYVNIDNNLPTVEVLLQVHDSLAGQYPLETAEQCRNDILKQSQIVLPYADPLVIPVGIKTSTKSWGDCE